VRIEESNGMLLLRLREARDEFNMSAFDNFIAASARILLSVL
jgi:hypothetical protein